MRKLVVPAILVALALCVAPAFAADPPAKPEPMKVGSTLVELNTMDMEGKAVTLNSLLKPNMLNVIAFTNSACYACATEAQVLTSIKGKHPGKVNLIGVVTDISPNSYKALPDSVKKSFSFVHDSEFQITPLFGFSATPATALVKGGKIVDLKTGFEPAKSAEFVEYIEKNL